MNFDYDSEQNDLREAVRGLLERAYGERTAALIRRFAPLIVAHRVLFLERAAIGRFGCRAIAAASVSSRCRSWNGFATRATSCSSGGNTARLL